MLSILKRGPAREPVSVAELQADLRLDTRDDALLASLITSARLMIEAQTGVRILHQQWEVLLDDWGGARLNLPHWPVASLNAISLLNGRSKTTVPDTIYELVPGVRPPIILLRPGQSWPTVRRAQLGISILLTAGFGDNAADAPTDLAQAVRRLAAAWYENSEWQNGATTPVIPKLVQTLIAPYRLMRL